MPSLRRMFDRAVVALVLVALLAPVAFVHAASGPAAITGSLTSKDKISFSSSAVAVIVLVDQSSGQAAGSIIGLQRINAPGNVPIAFSVPYDQGSIQPKGAYAIFASVQDDSKTWQNLAGVPVITGGPTSGVQVPLRAVSASPPAKVSGTITRTDKTALSSTAVAIAALIKTDTGIVVGSQVITAPGQSGIAFAIGFDPALVDPAATYVVRAAIIDAPSAWSSGAGVAVITDGAPTSGVSLPVTQSPNTIPTPQPTQTAPPKPTPTATPKPTAKPTPTTAPPKPTPKPSASPTAAPTATPKPTASPTATPTATPAPTATPSPTPTATPTAVPSVSVAPSPTATPAATVSPAAGTVTGTLVYAEPAKLSADARAVVLLVAGTTTPTTETIVGSQVIAPAGQQPISFSVSYKTADIDPKLTYTIQAEILDGDHAWATTSGVKVVTNGNPTSGVTVKLTLRADLLKGEVTGQITGVGIQLAQGAYSAAVLVRVDTGESLGVDVNPAPATVPIPFSIAFDPATIDPNADYVVRAEIVSGPRRWEDTTGVPVITKGNQLIGVSVPVTEVVAPTPTPTPSPSASPAPVPVEGGGSTSNWLILLVIILGIALAGALYLWYRARNPTGGPPAGAAAAATAVAPGQAPPKDQDAEAEASLSTDPAEPAEPAEPDTGSGEPTG